MPHAPFRDVFAHIVAKYGTARIQRVMMYQQPSSVRDIVTGKSSNPSIDRIAALSRWLHKGGDSTMVDWMSACGPKQVVEANGTLADERLLLEDIGAFGERAIHSGDERRIRRLSEQFEEAADHVRAEFSTALNRLSSERRQKALL